MSKSKLDPNQGSLSDSGATPYTYADYQDAVNILNERAVYRFTAEIESQWKKPYRVGDHPLSEIQYAGPDFPGSYPPIYPHYPQTGDCEVQGDALGGGYQECDPGDNCGVWVFSCCHRIIKFSAVNGNLKSVTVNADDTCRVTFCSDKDQGAIDATLNGESGEYSLAIQRQCQHQGEGHDPGCASCQDCIAKYKSPVINYASNQMGCSGTQLLSATGGNGGPYTWTVNGGTLAKLVTSANEGNLLTAPATNPNCTNIAVSVTDNCPPAPCEKDVYGVAFDAAAHTITFTTGGQPSIPIVCLHLATGKGMFFKSTTSGNNVGTFGITGIDYSTGVISASRNPVYSTTMTSETTDGVIQGSSMNMTELMISVNCDTTGAVAYKETYCLYNQDCYSQIPTRCRTQVWRHSYHCDDTVFPGSGTSCGGVDIGCCPPGQNPPCPCPCAACIDCSAEAVSCSGTALGSPVDVRTTQQKLNGCCPQALA